MSASKRTKIAALLSSLDLDINVNVKGWVRTKREGKNLSFIALNDGSTINNIQIVADYEQIDPEIVKEIHSGCCISVDGKIVQSLGKGQSVEINAENVEILGTSDPDQYPLQPKKHSLEFL